MANVVLFLDIVHAESRAVTKHKTLLEVYLKIIIIHNARLGFNSYYNYSLAVIRCFERRDKQRFSEFEEL